MALSRSRDSGMNYWPGFVDALSTLILSIIFLLTVFMVAQFFLSQEIAGKDTALARLNAQISRLSNCSRWSKPGRPASKTKSRSCVLRCRRPKASATGCAASPKARKPRRKTPTPARPPSASFSSQLDMEKEATARAVAQITMLNQQITALRRQIGALEQALGTSEQKEKDSQIHIADLGQRLNLALAQRVQELSRYRSDFFGKLREILGNRPDIRVVGDRFVFQSEVFFDSGAAVLRPEGRAELDKLATALAELEKKIPSDINWVLRVDGHTDTRQLSGNSPFKSNWELSAARAISVVQYLISKGISPQRLVAAGFGEFQPIDPGTTEEAFSRNRRIELKLTEK